MMKKEANTLVLWLSLHAPFDGSTKNLLGRLKRLEHCLAFIRK
ncbi:hypothetical protein [Streptococcus ovuberis]|nr:hypothetical protein [Streptococcus ovuberis]